MPYQISELQYVDLGPVIELAVAVFGEPMREAARTDCGATFADFPYRPKTFVAKDGERLVGMIQSLPVHFAGETQAFAWVGVHPQYRGQHIGTALVLHAEQETIEQRFKQRPGTFILHSSCSPEYYRAQGYAGGELTTHDGHPFLVKHYTPPSASVREQNPGHGKMVG